MKPLIKELERLNKAIDRKILQGQSYKKEAEAHANLYHFLKDHKIIK